MLAHWQGRKYPKSTRNRRTIPHETADVLHSRDVQREARDERRARARIIIDSGNRYLLIEHAYVLYLHTHFRYELDEYRLHAYMLQRKDSEPCSIY